MEKQNLFSPVKLGDLTLKNRIFFSASTRTRVDEDDVLLPIAAKYYAQRSSAGLIITEATYITPGGKVRTSQPGIFSSEQIAAWKSVTHGVHVDGGVIFAQLAHSGRSAIPQFNNGLDAVAPSSLAFDSGAHGKVSGQSDEESLPRELSIPEIKVLIKTYGKAAENAIKAGFDGVELHGGNAGLVEQFLHAVSNIRTDEYGGNIENRSRFLLEVIDELIEVCGKDRVGLRLSPHDRLSDQKDPDPIATVTYLATELAKRGIGYMNILEPFNKFDAFIPFPEGDPEVLATIRSIFKGLLIANGGYDLQTGNDAIETQQADAIGFARLFIANPDLPYRFENNLPLNAPDFSTFYGTGEKGYLDYPVWQDATLKTI